jgi:hypothetical protein
VIIHLTNLNTTNNVFIMHEVKKILREMTKMKIYLSFVLVVFSLFVICSFYGYRYVGFSEPKPEKSGNFHRIRGPHGYYYHHK